ncbi:MAG: hypothetical protein H6605_02355 [Flavobacteriales bacterium]|nr:hypothetical protein [Flavobacteriales bacterium]
MYKKINFFSLTLLSVIILLGCKKDDDDPSNLDFRDDVPEFFKATKSENYGKNSPVFTRIAGTSEQISEPQDLDFNPIRPDELWVLNRGVSFSGGSTVTISATGMPNQSTLHRKDGNALHFMALPTALSFNSKGNWATSSGELDANYDNGSFTGPTLWSSDPDIYAKYAGPGTNGSHLDMLHSSPFSMGIESERDNIFWVYDGYNEHLVRYDFQSDHGPGNHYHGDGKVHRYTEVKLKRDSYVPSHLVLDGEMNWLYIVDGGNKRILRADINSGEKAFDLPLINEELSEHWQMKNVVWEEFVAPGFGLQKPCGIEIKDDRLFVSDYETGEIICFNVKNKQELFRINTGSKGIMGLTLGSDGHLYYVNAINNEVNRIDPR